MTRTLTGNTILVSGGSRGIGLAIALRAARDGANFYTDEGVLREDLPDAPLPERP
jgi:NAD(P)-dependent dehydrogenase (short-subunit alcohol dehydrogenase family)